MSFDATLNYLSSRKQDFHPRDSLEAKWRKRDAITYEQDEEDISDLLGRVQEMQQMLSDLFQGLSRTDPCKEEQGKLEEARQQVEHLQSIQDELQKALHETNDELKVRRAKVHSLADKINIFSRKLKSTPKTDGDVTSIGAAICMALQSSQGT